MSRLVTPGSELPLDVVWLVAYVAALHGYSMNAKDAHAGSGFADACADQAVKNFKAAVADINSQAEETPE